MSEQSRKPGRFTSRRLRTSQSDEIRKAIADAIVETIRKRNLSRRDAASIIRVGQDKISLVFRRQVHGFSIARLLKFLSSLGYDIEILASDTPNSEPGHVRFSVMPLTRPGEPDAH